MKKKLLNSFFVLINKNKAIALLLGILMPFIGIAQIQHDLLLDLDFENGIADSSSELQATSLNGVSSYVADKWGNVASCIQFNGNSNNGSVFLTNDVSGTYKMGFPASFSAWVNISAWGSQNSPILTTEDHGSAFSGFWIEVSPAGAVLAHFGNGSGNSSFDKKTFETASGIINLNTWYHIAVVFKSANEASIYVNGFAKPTTISGSASSCFYYRVSGSAGKIGGYVKGTGNRTINGKIDKVKFFGTALNQSEVFALSYGNHVNHSTLLFNYNMDNNYTDTSIYHQTSAQVGACQYGMDKLSYANAALNVSSNSAIEIREATGNFKCSFPMTFASWVKVDALGSVNPIFTNDDNTGTYTGVWIQILGNGTIGVNIGDGSGTSASARRSYVTSNSLGADSQWRHIAVVLKSAPSPTLYTVEVYYDGVLWPVGAQSGSGSQLLYNTGNGNWGKLGCYNKGANSLSVLVGALDGSMFWNDSLTHADILNIVNNYYTGCLTLPTIQANATDDTICSGNPVTLNGAGGATYVWTGGVSNGTSFSPNSTATYTVTGTDVNSCSNSASVSVVVNTSPTVTINLSASTVCDGSSVTFSGNGASTYYWNHGVIDGQAFVPMADSVYTVVGVDANSCTGTADASLTVNSLPDVTTMLSGNTIMANEVGASFQWLDCNSAYAVINGAASQSYLPSVNGSYAVAVTKNGCSDTSSCTTISTVGVENNLFLEKGIVIYPSPASNHLTILNVSKTNCKMELIDVTGKVVYSNTTSNERTVVNISSFSNGLYFARFTSDGKVSMQKIVVSQ